MSNPSPLFSLWDKILPVIQAFLIFDLVYRIVLAERNRVKNLQRIADYQNGEKGSKKAPNAVACLVGYREDPVLFERALRSYVSAGHDFIVVGIDGNDKEDEVMVDIFRKVFNKHSKSVVFHLDMCIGKQFTEHLSVDDAKDNSPAARLKAHETRAYTKGYDFMKTQLLKSGYSPATTSDGEIRAVCFTQPHRDLKEIRYSAWMLSTVVADLCKIEYIWSSDSDTVVLPDTISNMTQILHMEPKAAGANALVQLNNAHDSVFSSLAATAWTCDIYMNRSANSGTGRSECLNGPCSAYRIAVLRDIIVPWYRGIYPGSRERTTINEDMQATMLVSKKGWQRFFTATSIVHTRGPTNLRGWIGQRIRWSRGIHLHRRYDWRFIMSQGILYTMYMIRSAVYDCLLFIWVAYYALTGTVLVRVPWSMWIVLELIPPCYNYARFPANPHDLSGIKTVFLYLLYRFICPVYRMYTWFTPFNSSWALATKSLADKSGVVYWLRREQEMIFAWVWFALAGTAAARAILSQ